MSLRRTKVRAAFFTEEVLPLLQEAMPCGLFAAPGTQQRRDGGTCLPGNRSAVSCKQLPVFANEAQGVLISRFLKPLEDSTFFQGKLRKRSSTTLETFAQIRETPRDGVLPLMESFNLQRARRSTVKERVDWAGKEATFQLPVRRPGKSEERILEAQRRFQANFLALEKARRRSEIFLKGFFSIVSEMAAALAKKETE